MEKVYVLVENQDYGRLTMGHIIGVFKSEEGAKARWDELEKEMRDCHYYPDDSWLEIEEYLLR